MGGRRRDPRRFRLNKTSRDIDVALRRLVNDAYAHVRTFRERMRAAGVHPGAITGVADIERIPLTDRRAFVSTNRPDYLRADTDPALCRRVQTSGTTGTPLDIFMSHGESLYRKLLLLRAIRKNTTLPLPFTIVEVGTGEVALSRRGATQSLGFARVVRIPRLMPVVEQVERVIASCPDVVTGAPSCIEILADELAERKGTVAPRLVISRGEMLRAATRDRLREVFQCSVVDYYNCDEVGNVAWQCPRDTAIMHVNTDACIVEVLAGERRCPPGVSGRVVLTNLYNWTMPFIRYELGDRAALVHESGAACSCGHRGASLSLLEGREGDYLWTSDGRRISPRSVDSLIAIASLCVDSNRYAVRRYQVVQQEDGRLHVRVIPETENLKLLAERIEASLGRLDAKLPVDIEFVDAFPVESSGKFCAIYSKQHPPIKTSLD